MTTETMRFCAVIPVFENASTVVAVVRAALGHVDVLIVVDDGSRDRTRVNLEVGLALAAAPGLRIERITFRRNHGKGAALVAGFRRALALGCTHAVTIDADGQHRASDIPALRAAAAAHPQAIVVGARNMDGASIPDAARLGRRVSNFWTHRSTGFDLPDTTCGFRVYPLREVVALRIRTRRYDYEGEVLVRGAWAGLELLSVPIDVWYPADRTERVSHYRPWLDSVRITVMYVRLALRRLLPMGRTERAIPGVRPPKVRLRDTVKHLRELTASGTRPNEVALAVGVGVFVGATPLWGFHAPLMLYIATRWRLNLVVSFLATNVSFPAFAPALVFAEIQFGRFLRSGEWLDLRRDEFSLSSVSAYGIDYLVGGFAFAALLGIVAGLVTLKAGSMFARRRLGEQTSSARAGAT